MKLIFNEKKATQLASIFIGLSGGSLNYMKLIKLMYLVERKALLSWGRPVTHDSYYSLKRGPILSSTYNLISEGVAPGIYSYWLEHISSPSNYEVKILKECPTEELSRAEESLIQDIFDEFGHIDVWALIDLLHETLPEWKDPSGSSLPIDIKDILNAGGLPEMSIREIVDEIEGLAAMDRLLNPA
jgi:uncharacterized phage-associated protein